MKARAMPLPGPQFFYKGGFYNSPAQIRMLQFNQLRSHLYPRDPYLAGEALEEFGQPVPQYLPQRMMFSRWKTPPMRTAWLQNAESALAAPQIAQQRVAQMQEAANLPPMLPMWDAPAALGANQLPETPVEMDETPLSRGVLPYQRMQIHAGELAALLEEQNRDLEQRHEGAQDRRDLALAEVNNQISAISFMVTGGDDQNEPWYERRG